MTVPIEVAVATRRRWPDRAEPWLDAVGDELAELCAIYAARPVRTFSSRYSYAVGATGPHGQLVFRATPDPSGAAQASVSCALAELGVAPVVYDSRATRTGHWTVMDWILPGTPLGNNRGSRMSTADLAEVLVPTVGRRGPALPYIGDWLHERLACEALIDLAPGRTPAPAAERAHAIDVLEELTATGVQELCHGDTSPGNVLLGHDQTLWLIDPRGFSGEVAYDVAVLAAKTSSGRSLNERLGDLATAVGTPIDRVNAWYTVAKAARV